MSNIYIIVVNYKGLSDTIECLESILAQGVQKFSVVVVDNSPGDDDLNRLEEWVHDSDKFQRQPDDTVGNQLSAEKIPYARVKEEDLPRLSAPVKNEWIFIKANENLGFAHANNIALNFLKGITKPDDYFWLLNNDTILGENALQRVWSYILKFKPSIMGTSLMEYSKPEMVQAIGGIYNPWLSTLQLPVKEEVFLKSKNVRYPNGASMIVSGNFLREVGLLEEKYFLYFEELDWVLRGRKKGFKPLFYIDDLVYHKGGGSTGKNNDMVDYYYMRSRFLIAKQYFRSKLPLTLTISMIMFPLNRIRKMQFGRIPVLFKAVSDVFIHNERNSFR